MPKPSGRRLPDVWTLAFASSVVAALLCAAWLFGMSAFTAWTGVAVLGLAAANALLGAKKDVPQQGQRLVQRHYKATTIGLWIVIVAAVTLTRRIAIEGVVMTSEGAPAAGTMVTLIGTPARAVSDAAGAFRLDVHVGRWRVPERFVVRVERGAAVVEAAIPDVRAVPVRVTMPPIQPPLRISYLQLKKRDIDLLLAQPRDERWEEALRGGYFIIANDVYTELRRMVKQFSEQLDPNVVDAVVEAPSGAFALRDPPLSSFVGSSGEVTVDIFLPHALQTLQTNQDIVSLPDPRKPWRLYRAHPGPDDVHTLNSEFVFRRYSTRADFARFDERLARFWSYVTREWMPPDFGWTDLVDQFDDECLDIPGGVKLFVAAPLLRLNVAIVENISDRPVTLGDFSIRANPASRLRTPAHDEAILARSPSRPERPFTIEQLRPGETFVIPLSMVLVFDTEADETRYGASGLRPYRVPIHEELPFGRYTIAPSTLGPIIQRDPLPPITTYVYGPSVHIDALRVDWYTLALRPRDPRESLVRNVYAFGSCPYFLGFSKSEQRWIDGGVILYGQKGAANARWDERPLPAFDGRVQIEEREPETSYIDALHVIAVDAAGRRLVLMPRDPRLRRADGTAIVLRTGDSIVVEYDVPRELTNATYRLAASGYYVPDGWNRNAQRTRP